MQEQGHAGGRILAPAQDVEAAQKRAEYFFAAPINVDVQKEMCSEFFCAEFFNSWVRFPPFEQHFGLFLISKFGMDLLHTHEQSQKATACPVEFGLFTLQAILILRGKLLFVLARKDPTNCVLLSSRGIILILW